MDIQHEDKPAFIFSTCEVDDQVLSNLYIQRNKIISAIIVQTLTSLDSSFKKPQEKVIA